MAGVPCRAEAVADDHDLGDLMDQYDRGESEHTEEREREQDHDDGQRQGNVAGHDLPPAAGMSQGVGDQPEVGAGEGDVRGLHRSCRPGDAHRDSDRGRGQGGGVVDAVTDHRGGRLIRRAADVVGLVGRQLLGALGDYPESSTTPYI